MPCVPCPRRLVVYNARLILAISLRAVVLILGLLALPACLRLLASSCFCCSRKGCRACSCRTSHPSPQQIFRKDISWPAATCVPFVFKESRVGGASNLDSGFGVIIVVNLMCVVRNCWKLASHHHWSLLFQSRVWTHLFGLPCFLKAGSRPTFSLKIWGWDSSIQGKLVWGVPGTDHT